MPLISWRHFWLAPKLLLGLVIAGISLASIASCETAVPTVPVDALKLARSREAFRSAPRPLLDESLGSGLRKTQLYPVVLRAVLLVMKADPYLTTIAIELGALEGAATMNLNKNLVRVGVPRVVGFDAHHIVPFKLGLDGSDECRQILRFCGIPINAPINGVFLPRDFHRPLHTGQYTKGLAESLRRANFDPARVKQVLADKNDQLIKEAFQTYGTKKK